MDTNKERAKKLLDALKVYIGWVEDEKIIELIAVYFDRERNLGVVDFLENKTKNKLK